jgi:hypothetical protein
MTIIDDIDDRQQSLTTLTIDDIDDRRQSLTALTINIDNRSQLINNTECQCNCRSKILKIEIESGRLLQ